MALTFDDGPSQWTAPILDTLEAAGGRGTFFVLGCRIEGNEAVLKRAVDGGHELASHGWGHENPTELDDRTLRADLDAGRHALARTVGRASSLYRPPFARHNRRVVSLAKAAGFTKVILFNIGPRDYAGIDAAQIVTAVLADVGAGDIVCLHDGVPTQRDALGVTREPTVDAMTTIVPALRRRGLELVTVSDLLGYRDDV